jgi:hypothetical protein
VAAALAQGAHRVAAGRGDPEGVDRDLGAAAGQVVDRLCRIAVAGVDPVQGAELPGEIELLGVDVDGDHLGTQSRGDHHSGEADAAAAVHGDPFARLHIPRAHQALEGGHEAAAHGGGGEEVDGIGQGDAVDVGALDRDQLAEAAPGHEAGLKGIVADLMVAREAPLAVAAAAAEGHHDPVALLDPAHVGPGLDHHAGELVPQHRRELQVGPMADPGVPVAAADAAGGRLEDDAVRRASGVGKLRQLHRLAKSVHDDCAHSGSPVRGARGIRVDPEGPRKKARLPGQRLRRV